MSDAAASCHYRSQERMQQNPFAPPTADYVPPRLRDDDWVEQPLASRGARLWASILDGLVSMLVIVPLAFVSELISDRDVFVALFLLVFVGFWGFQWFLVSTTGQTLGKRWAGIRIVKVDGSPVNFVSGVLVRAWAFTVLTWVPYLGALLALANYACILGDERRCLHDYLAKTMVVQA